jgi:phosphopantetheine adenylyltransferase
MHFGGDIDSLVPQAVAEALREDWRLV